MILFKKDWIRYPRAIVDYSTKNESFKRMVRLYREMGVDNCLFPLTLMQPELQGVDPHSAILSDETKLKIGMECQYNIWYFLREVVKIPPIAGPHPISYKANRGNLGLTWGFLNNIDCALIQPRQTGKSVSTDCLMVWVLYIGATNTKINMITKDHVLRTKNVERLKKIRDLLPPYLISISNKDTDNQTDLTCKDLDNAYITGVGQTSESAANNLGRGLTSPVSHIDEGPFIRFIGTTIPAALASGTQARAEAAMYNRPYGNIFTTTAGKKDDRDGKYMYNLIHGGAPWNEIFLDAKDKAELFELVKRNGSGRKRLLNITMSHRQLGYTDEWLYNAIVETGATDDEANRDFFNIWTSGTESSPLSIELNELIKDSEIDPVWSEISKDSYITRWYVTKEELERLVKETHFIIGLDTSDAIGRDSIGLIIMDSRDLSVVGGATINETNLIRFSKYLADLLIKYSNTILIPEKKSSAQAIIDSLIIHLVRANIDPFKRIYNRVVDNHRENPKEYEEIQTPMNKRNNAFYDKWKKVFGFNTTGQSRELLYGTVLQNTAKSSGHLVKDRQLSTEIRGLVVKNGRIDHSSDTHDDMVIAWMMASWMLTHSKNLSFYGINTNAIMAKTGQTQGYSIEQQIEMEEQNMIREEMEDIFDELCKTKDEYMVTLYENRLLALNKRMKVGDLDAISIDALLSQANEKRDQEIRRKAIDQRRKDNSTPGFKIKSLGRQQRSYNENVTSY